MLLNHTPDDRERENNLLLLLLLRAFVWCVSEDALFEAKAFAVFEGKKEQSFASKVSEKTCTQICAIRGFSYER